MARASGYTAAEPEGLAVGGGFKDWFIEEFRRPAFTIEAGKGRNPLPMSQLDEIYASVQPLLDRLCVV
jgi:g-D-glutamyl-meso-diaminopimelate peptidase